MNTKLAITLSLFAGTSAFAGSAQAQLECKGRDGLTISGSIPGDEADFSLSITQGAKSTHLYSQFNQETLKVEENATASVVDELKDGVWTLTSSSLDETAYGSIRMYALPKTIRYQSLRYGYKASFTAKVRFYLNEISTEAVESSMACTLKYEI